MKLEKNLEKSKEKNKNRNQTWIMVSVLVPIIIASSALYFYLLYYTRSNFSDLKSNFISQNSGKITKPGDEITYTINYKNEGSTSVKNLKIETEIPSNTTFIEVDDTSRDIFTLDGGKIMFKIGDVAIEQSGNVGFKVKVNVPLDNKTVIKTSAVIYHYQARSNKYDYQLLSKASCTVESSPDFKNTEIFIQRDGDSKNIQNNQEITVNDTVIFKIVLSNSGNMDAKNFKVINFLPEGFEVIQSEVSSSGIYDQLSNRIIWDIDELKAGRKKDVAFKVIVGKDFEHQEIFKNKIAIIFNSKTQFEKGIEGKVNALPDYSKSTVEVTDINGGKLWALDKLQYKVLLKNTGKRDGFNIEVYCPIPAGTGYIEGSAIGERLIMDGARSLVKLKIDRIKAGEVMKFTFKVFVADYLTGEGEINSDFYIRGNDIKIELENPVLEISPYVFYTVVCMGDSQVVLSKWPEILDELLERQYPHAEFNTIASGVKGEMATNAIKRFDKDVRLHNPDIIILGYGDNDAGEETSLYRYHMGILIRQAISTGAKVFVHGVGFIDTSLAKWAGKANYTVFNDILKNNLCPQYGAVYIDLYSIMSKEPEKYIKADGMHWNKTGAELAANEIFKTMTKYLDRDGRLIDR